MRGTPRIIFQESGVTVTGYSSTFGAELLQLWADAAALDRGQAARLCAAIGQWVDSQTPTAEVPPGGTGTARAPEQEP